MGSGEKVILPAVTLKPAEILSARKILSYLQTSPNSQGTQILIPTARDVTRL